jgi:hypothetical protein
MTIKILRLKSGYDIICKCEMYDDIIEIEDAMLFEVRGVNLALQHWMPAAVVKENKTHMMMENILCFFDPTDDFMDYYSEIVQKMKKSLEDLKNQDEGSVEELLKDITENTLKGSYIH